MDQAFSLDFSMLNAKRLTLDNSIPYTARMLYAWHRTFRRID